MLKVLRNIGKHGLLDGIAHSIADHIPAKGPVTAAQQSGVKIGIGSTLMNDMDTKAVEIPWAVLNRHVYLLGATGSGKTITLRNMAYQLVTAGAGCLFIDFKGEVEIMHDLVRACHETGRQDDFVYLSPVLSNKYLQETATWNPLLSQNRTTSTTVSKLMDSFEKGVSTDSKGDYFAGVKFDLLLTACLAMDSIGKPYTFRDMALALSPEGLAALLAQTPDAEARRRIESLLTEYDDNPRMFSQNIKGTRVILEELASGMIAPLICTTRPTFDLYDAIVQQKVVYCYLPSMYAKRTMQAVAKMILAEIKLICARLQAFETSRPNFAMIIDEFEECAGIPGVKDLFTKARSAGLSIIVGHQTLSDIDFETGDKAFTESLMDNTATKLLMQLNSKKTAEMMADIIGHMPELPLIGQWFKQKNLIPPDVFMGRNEIYENGLEVGELIAKIGAEIYRVKVPLPTVRDQIVVGKDIPRPSSRNYPIYDHGPALGLAEAMLAPRHQTAPAAGSQQPLKKGQRKGGSK